MHVPNSLKCYEVKSCQFHLLHTQNQTENEREKFNMQIKTDIG